MARTKVDDLISRRAVIKALEKAGMVNYMATGDFHGIINALNVIKALPAAEPKPGKGLRIKGEQSYVCRDCGQRCLETIMLLPKWDYCPNCGAYMGDEND